MSLILRGIKGEPLTYDELDNNFIYLDNKPSGGGATGPAGPAGPTGPGGGASQSLSQVLSVDNITDGNDIAMSGQDSIVLDNNSRLRKGTTDAGLGGNHGISQICAIDYELKWEAGRLYVMNGASYLPQTIRQSLYNFTTAPTISDDDTKGYLVGSIWSLDDLTNYVCSDNSTGAAVWNLIPSPSPSQFAAIGVTTTQGPFSTGGAGNYIRLPFVGTGNINGVMGTASGGDFGVKLGLRTHAYQVYASADVEIGNNKTAALKLKMEVGGFLSLTECRSRTTSSGTFAKVVTDWIIVPSDITNDYESIYLTIANITDTSGITIQRCRIVVTDLGLYVP
jgi:hypothetical protein